MAFLFVDKILDWRKIFPFLFNNINASYGKSLAIVLFTTTKNLFGKNLYLWLDG